MIGTKRKLKLRYSILWSLLAIPFVIFAQSEDRNSQLSISVGPAYISLKDKVFSDLNFKGLVYGAQVDFERTTEKQFLSIGVQGQYGPINYKNFFPTDYIDMRFQAKFAKMISSGMLKDFYIGGMLNAGLNVIDYNGYDNGSWTSGYSLNVLLRKELVKNEKYSLEGEFHYPLGALMSRPRYAGRDEFVFANTDKIPRILFTKNKIYSLNKLVNPSLRFRYTYRMKKVNLISAFEYEYFYVDSVRNYIRHGLGLSFGVSFKLK